MKILDSLITLLLAIAVIAVGIILKRYTAGRLRDIDGISPIIRQDLGNGNVIGEFGKKTDK